MRRSTRSRRPNDKVKTKYFPLKGGLNLVDAPITMPPGMVLSAINYELLTRDGYRRIDGFERYDGQESPSDASYWILDYYESLGVISEGNIVHGSSATGTILSIVEGTVTNLMPNPEDLALWPTGLESADGDIMRSSIIAGWTGLVSCSSGTAIAGWTGSAGCAV